MIGQPLTRIHTETRPWCTFRLGDDLYGLDVLAIREVALLPIVTPVPHAPPGILGCVNLRGQIHVILDLAALLGRQATKPGPHNRLILFKNELGNPFGVLVEGIGDIVQVPIEQVENRVRVEELESAEQTGSPEETLVLGVARMHEELLLLLDARRLLTALQRSNLIGETNS